MARFGHAASAVALLVALSTTGPGQAQSVQTDYTYDVHGRLTKVTRPSSTTDYTYDNAQNRTHVTTTQSNSVPTAGPDTIQPTVGVAYTFDPRGNDSDPDTDPLTITGVLPPVQGRGSVSYTATSVTYTPFTGQGGQGDSFTYTISDGKGGTATGTVTVNIQAVTQPPVAQAFTVSITPNGLGNVASYSLPLSFTGGTPTSVAYSGLGVGSASVSGNSILYSSSGWTGQTTLQYTGTNGGGTSAPATATIKVTPVISNASLTANAGQAKIVSLSPYAVTTSGITSMSLPNGPNTPKGTASFSGTSLTYTPNANATGTDTFAYTATSAGGTSAAANVTFTITAATPPPVVSPSTTTVTGNYSGSINTYPLTLNISGGAPTSLAITSPSPNGTASVSGSVISFTPTTAFSGQTALQYTATNAGGTSAPATATINVRPVVSNVSGTATTGAQSILALYPRTTYTSMSLTTSPSYGTAYISGGNVYYTPSNGTAGLTDTFTYTATSGGVTSTSASISFNIIQGNRAPTAVDQIVDQDQSTTATLFPLGNDNDLDGDPLTLQSVGPLEFVYGNNGTPGSLGTLTKTGNTVSYTAPFVCNCAYRSSYHVIRFSYTVADSKGATSTAKHAINVYSNQAPTAVTQGTDVEQSAYTSVFPLRNDTDPDGHPLTIKSIDNVYFAYGRINGVDLSGAPADIGSVTNNGSYLTYRSPFLTSSGAYHSSYVVVVVWYTVSDGHGGTSQSYETIVTYAPS